MSNSGVEHNVSVRLSDCKELIFRLSGPPQFDDERAYELARFHMRAFFYLITYDDASRLGGFWKGGFHPVHGTIKTDRGNQLHRSFMN